MFDSYGSILCSTLPNGTSLNIFENRILYLHDRDGQFNNMFYSYKARYSL